MSKKIIERYPTQDISKIDITSQISSIEPFGLADCSCLNISVTVMWSTPIVYLPFFPETLECNNRLLTS